jgi:pyruvate,water dikinase
MMIMTTLANDEWNATLAGNYLWSNTNFGEAVTQAMTPLSWSVIQYTLADWVFLPGYSTVGNIAGRPYLNISVFATVYQLLGRSQQDLLAYMEATLYMQLPAGVEIPLIRLPRRRLLPILWGLARLRRQQAQGARRVSTYLAQTPGWFQRMRHAIQSAQSPESLLRLWHQEIDRNILDGRWTVLGTATLSADYTLALRRRLQALVGDEDASLLIGNLGADAGLLASLEPLLGLQRVARGSLSPTAYLDQFGHRGPHEFELSVPRPAEDSAWLEQQVAQIRAAPLEVEAHIASQQAAHQAAWQRFTTSHPSLAGQMQRRMQESARRGRLREQARSEYVRQRWLLRLFALRAAELCNLGEDVFFLRLEEVLARLGGDTSGLAHIPAREQAYQATLALPSPPAIILGRFDPFAWAADPQRRTDLYTAGQPILAAPASSTLLRGAAGSAGVVVGFVRRLDLPDQAGELQPGEILVTAMTDISWTPLFPRLAAVVTDVGAPLSHAAIVARELGIPAVVGCGDATLRLHTGDRVRVDGGKGVVEVLG